MTTQQVDSLGVLLSRYGPMMNARDVVDALRFKNSDALRAARKAGRLGFEMFPLDGRRGLFARTEDVAKALNRITGTPQEPKAD